MAESQSFSQRVLVPLGVIALTVSGLSIMGLSLWNMGSASSASATSTNSVSTTEDMLTANGYLPVNVFNASDVPGLARKAASKLQEQNWTVNTIGNWSGAKVKESTIFYPADAKDSAAALAAQVKVGYKPAASSMSQSELTYVIAR